MTPRIDRTHGSYSSQLRTQRELLRNAASRFDEGSRAEAVNLAARLRVLLYDGRKPGAALLAQLGLRDTLPLLDTALAEPPPGVLVMGGGLCMITAILGDPGGSQYRAALGDLSPDRIHPPAAFVDWWDEPIFTGDSETKLSRSSLVRWVANQDGGAHVDPRIDSSYATLVDQGVQTFNPSGLDKNLAWPSVRQIAYELEMSLDRGVFEDASAPSGVRVASPICSLSIRSAPVGRNDPCPCGSGRKAKRCFGTRQPRRRMSMDGATG
jgi:hypothetical protein